MSNEVNLPSIILPSGYWVFTQCVSMRTYYFPSWNFFSRAELQYMVWFRLSEWWSTINEFFSSPQGISLLKVSLWNITEYTFCMRKIVLHMLRGIWWDFIKWIRIAILVYICVLWCKKSYTICHYDHRHTLWIS